MMKLPQDIYFKTKGGYKQWGKNHSSKPIAILTNDINKNIFCGSDDINEVYLDSRFKKHIMVKPNIKDRFESYLNVENEMEISYTNTLIEDVPDLKLANAIDYLRTKYNYEQVLVECGNSTTKEYYEPYYNEETKKISKLPTLFDLVYVAVYRGPIHPSCVGPVFPNF